MKKILQIIEVAYRGTIEEQDDTVIWLSHVLKDTGCNIDILLRGNAVNYILKSQDASGLVFGEKKQINPPKIELDILKIIEKKVEVYFCSEDANILGLVEDEIIVGVKPISNNDFPLLFSKYDQIWHW